jgi:3-methylcrotonyl-CoA carboxylase alpha subunit
VFGDTHGNIVHLFERDCSLQRRHQKVIEEAPAPGMDEATREQLCAAAVKAAKAVDYVGAGTIEFIADASEGLRADRIWFMEMNTRLQVEHPVTEEITGVDLVEWQLRVASGEALPLRQDELSITGWAMEARLYAEDPAKGFLPSVGKFQVLDLHEYDLGEYERLETGVDNNSEVTPFYDPMIAKLVMWRQTRGHVAAELAALCSTVTTVPVKNNGGFLGRCLRHSEFVDGEIDTGFIERNLDALLDNGDLRERMAQHAAIKLNVGEMFYTQQQSLSISGLRLNAAPRISARVIDENDKVFDVEISEFMKPGWTSEFGNTIPDATNGVTVFGDGDAIIFRKYRFDGVHGQGVSDGDILSPMPGRIIAVEVTQGQTVTKGQKLLTLEAMKMEHSLTAPFDGVVAELNAEIGAQVQVDALLVRIEPAEE